MNWFDKAITSWINTQNILPCKRCLQPVKLCFMVGGCIDDTPKNYKYEIMAYIGRDHPRNNGCETCGFPPHLHLDPPYYINNLDKNAYEEVIWLFGVHINHWNKNYGAW